MNKVFKFTILYETFKNETYYYLVSTNINEKDNFFLIYQYSNELLYNIDCENFNKYFEIYVNIINNEIILPKNVHKISFNKTGFYFHKNNITLNICNSSNEFQIEIPKLRKITQHFV
jgi:hypothetical protein